MNRGDAPARPVGDSNSVHKIGHAAMMAVTAEDPSGREKEYSQACAAAAGGMTVREEFAKAAMQGYLANPMLHNRSVLEDIVTAAGRRQMSPPEIVAMLAVEQADALIAELAKVKP